VLEIINKVLW